MGDTAGVAGALQEVELRIGVEIGLMATGWRQRRRCFSCRQSLAGSVADCQQHLTIAGLAAGPTGLRR